MPTLGSTDITSILLFEETLLAPTDRVVILNAEDAGLVVAVGRQAAETVVYAASLSALAHIRQQAAARAVPNIRICDDVFPVEEAQFDVALLPVPKGRDYARGLLMSARRALKPGGKLYIAGPTEGGTKSLISDAAVIFGASSTLTYRQRARIGVAQQPETRGAYPAEWGIDPTHLQTREMLGLTIHTLPGVFSWEHLDDGSALLIAHMAVAEGDRVLDMGCGYGIVGLMAATRGANQVTLSDDNLLAVRCARASAAANAITNVEIVAGDLLDAVKDQRFDLIVSNPPFHQQFDVNTNVAHRLIREAKSALKPGGRLVIVANAFLKYETVMQENLTRVRTLVNDNRYRVIEGRVPDR